MTLSTLADVHGPKGTLVESNRRSVEQAIDVCELLVGAKFARLLCERAAPRNIGAMEEPHTAPAAKMRAVRGLLPARYAR